MPRPIPLKVVLKVLHQKGFIFVSQKGSHAKFKKIGTSVLIVIIKTTKKEIPHGTFMSILLKSGLDESEFRK